jgi:hypothetical protein
MSMKYALFVLFALTLLASFSVADSITNYKVPSTVLLGESITATGFYNSDINTNSGFLCDFYITDQNGVLLTRFTAQYTTGTGRFTGLNLKADEPVVQRGGNYRLVSECGGATADANFVVGQRRTIADQASNEFEYLTNPENVDTIIIWVILGGTILFIIGIVVYLVQKARGR